MRSPAIGSIILLGLLLLAIFLVWLGGRAGALPIDLRLLHAGVPHGFVREVLTTPQGWTLIIIGNAIGFVFSIVVLAISVFSFPMLVDRHVSAAVGHPDLDPGRAAPTRHHDRLGVHRRGAPAVGFIPLFFGLAVTLPILGHATWHLYRRVVGP